MASYGSEDAEESVDREFARQVWDGLSDGESAASDAKSVFDFDSQGHKN